MPKKERKNWDAEQGRYTSEDDPTKLKHDPYNKPHAQREYVFTFECEVCGAEVTLRGADKVQVDAALVQLNRVTGGHNLCDICISVGTRHYNLKERRAFWLKHKRRV